MTQSLAERFVANAEAAGFVVHRGEVPEIEGSERSTASYGLADTGSVVLAAAPDGAAHAPSASGASTSPYFPNSRILAGSAELFAAVGSDLPERPRNHHRPQPQRRHRATPGRRRARPPRGACCPAPVTDVVCLGILVADAIALAGGLRCRRGALSSSSTTSRSTGRLVRSIPRARWSGSASRPQSSGRSEPTPSAISSSSCSPSVESTAWVFRRIRRCQPLRRSSSWTPR